MEIAGGFYDSARDPRDRGKSRETSTLSRLWIVTADEVRYLRALSLEPKVTGETRQSALSVDMVSWSGFPVWHVRRFTPLYPRDVLHTGTPQYVGAELTAPKHLTVGDTLEVPIAGPATQHTWFCRADVLAPR